MRRSLNIFFWLLFFFVVSTLVGGAGYFIREHYAPVSVTLEQATLTGVRDPIILHFSKPMRSKSLQGKVQLSLALPIDMAWRNLDTELVLTPTTAWPMETSINLFVGQGQTRYFSDSTATSFSITTPQLPKILVSIPASGSRDVMIDIEDPIKVVFDRPVSDYYIDFRIDSMVATVYQSNPEKTAFEILPQVPLLPGKEYTFNIYAKWRGAGDDTYIPFFHSNFTTISTAPSAWNSDLSLRVEEAKRFTRAKKPDGKYIDINLSNQVMSLFENGHVLDAYIISSGKRGLETPKGEFAITNKADRPWSKKYSLFMPYWMAIVPSGLFGIHELPEWPGGYKEGENHLGIPVSHGCVRLGVGPAKHVFEWADIGTPVVIY